MRETTQSIYVWGNDVFGLATDPERIVARARLEFDELVEAVAKGENAEAIVAEAADVVILLNRLAGFCGRDLADAVDAKMKINRARSWVRNGDGTGRHV